MRLMVELPDELAAALEDLAVRERREPAAIVAELVRRGLDEPSILDRDRRRLADEWLEQWSALGRRLQSTEGGPTLREQLAADRDRLDTD